MVLVTVCFVLPRQRKSPLVCYQVDKKVSTSNTMIFVDVIAEFLSGVSDVMNNSTEIGRSKTFPFLKIAQITTTLHETPHAIKPIIL